MDKEIKSGVLPGMCYAASFGNSVKPFIFHDSQFCILHFFSQYLFPCHLKMYNERDKKCVKIHLYFGDTCLAKVFFFPEWTQ